MGDIKQRSGQPTLDRQKIYTKNSVGKQRNDDVLEYDEILVDNVLGNNAEKKNPRTAATFQSIIKNTEKKYS
jgi:hypothetical protein